MLLKDLKEHIGTVSQENYDLVGLSPFLSSKNVLISKQKKQKLKELEQKEKEKEEPKEESSKKSRQSRDSKTKEVISPRSSSPRFDFAIHINW